MSRLKKCKGCEKVLDLQDFYRDAKAKDSRMGRCKKCHNSRLVKQRQTNPRSKLNHRLGSRRYKNRHPAKVRAKDRGYYHERGGKEKNTEWRDANWGKVIASLKRSEARNRIKVKARNAVRNAIRRGELINPGRCQKCGHRTKKLDAHHHRGYTRRYWLDIQWICEDCHGKTRRIDNEES